jgi:hypothetical protein
MMRAAARLIREYHSAADAEPNNGEKSSKKSMIR